MSDRNSAEIYERIFTVLAELPASAEVKAKARMIWDLTPTYDFTPEMMECDDALIKLGLAKSITLQDLEALNPAAAENYAYSDSKRCVFYTHPHDEYQMWNHLKVLDEPAVGAVYQNTSDLTVVLSNSKELELSRGQYKTMDDAMMCAGKLMRDHDLVEGMKLCIDDGVDKKSGCHIIAFVVKKDKGTGQVQWTMASGYTPSIG